ncbi:hypothetical protein STEG23_013345 [Scotinomys teguina]
MDPWDQACLLMLYCKSDDFQSLLLGSAPPPPTPLSSISTAALLSLWNRHSLPWFGTKFEGSPPLTRLNAKAFACTATIVWYTLYTWFFDANPQLNLNKEVYGPDVAISSSGNYVHDFVLDHSI